MYSGKYDLRKRLISSSIYEKHLVRSHDHDVDFFVCVLGIIRN